MIRASRLARMLPALLAATALAFSACSEDEGQEEDAVADKIVANYSSNCKPIGASCGNSNECCQMGTCVGGRCDQNSCQPGRELCISTTQCCSGLVCIKPTQGTEIGFCQ